MRWIGFALLCLATAPVLATDIVSCLRREAVAEDLAPLAAMSQDARVLALGEPAHGAHEPLALRNRVFEYLVEHGDFTAVALETAFTESHALHDRVATGRSADLRELTRQTLSWGFGEFAENVELLQWLADYNANPAHRRKVQFYGIDISGADNQDAFSNGAHAVEAALRSLKSADATRAARFEAELAGLLPDFSDSRYSKLRPGQTRLLLRLLAAISAALQSNQAAISAASSPEQFEWAVHDIRMAQRLQSMFSVRSPRTSDSTMLPDDYRVVNVRDAVMAENVLWVLQQEGPKGKVLVFAHNAHVMNASSRGGIWNVFSQPPRMMGQHLRSSLGSKLVIVGTLAGTTGIGLPKPAALNSSLESMLAQLDPPLTFLDLHRAACNQGAAAWLRQLRPIHANFDTWLDVELDRAFDAVEFISELSRARQN